MSRSHGALHAWICQVWLRVIVGINNLCQSQEHGVVAAVVAWPCRSQFKQGKSAQQVADCLVEIAIKRYTTDNVAVIVADMKGTDAWKARPKSNRKGLLSGFFGKKE